MNGIKNLNRALLRVLMPPKTADIVAERLEELEKKQNALRARVESASAIITELLARTAKCDCRESDEAVAAAMAWLHDNK